MDCPGNSETLSAYIDNELTDQELRAVESHLSQCAKCRRELQSLQATISLVSSLPRVSAPVNLAEAVRAHRDPGEAAGAAPLEEAESPPRRPAISPPARRAKRHLLWPAMAAAAALFLAIGVGLRSRLQDHGADETRITAAATQTAEKGAADREEKATAESETLGRADVKDIHGDGEIPAPAEDGRGAATVKLECEDLGNDRARVLSVLAEMKVLGEAAGSQVAADEGTTERKGGAEDVSKVVVLLSRAQRERLYGLLENMGSIRIVGGRDALVPPGARIGADAMGGGEAAFVGEVQEKRSKPPRADAAVAGSPPPRKSSVPKTRRLAKKAARPETRRLGAAALKSPFTAEGPRPSRRAKTRETPSAPSLATKREAPESAVIAQSRATAQKMLDRGKQPEATSLSRGMIRLPASGGKDEEVKKIEIHFIQSRIGGRGK